MVSYGIAYLYCLHVYDTPLIHQSYITGLSRRAYIYSIIYTLCLTYLYIYGRLIDCYDNDVHECILLKCFHVIRIELSENKQFQLNKIQSA